MSAYIKMIGYFPKGTLLQSYKVKKGYLSISGLQHIIREIAKKSCLTKKLYAYYLRHTYAVHFLNNDGHLPQLQRLLGHSHISTTLHYLKYAHHPLQEIETPLDCLMAH